MHGREKGWRAVFLLVGLALGGCFTPLGTPATYSPARGWQPRPPAGGFAPPREPNPPLPEVLDMQAAVRIALAGNPGLREAFMRVEAARARLAQSVSGYLPALDARFGYSKPFQVPVQRTVPGLNVEIPFYSIGLRGTWVLFDGLAREYRVQAANLDVEESRARHEDARRLLVQAVERAFFDALGAVENVRIAEADLTYEQELLEETRQRQAAGDRSLSDRLNFEVRVETARATLTRSRAALETLRVVLAELLDLQDGKLPATVALARLTAEPPADLEPPEATGLVKTALGRRPDLGAARAAVDRARAAVGAADGSWWPTVSLSGEAGRQRFKNARFRSSDNALSLAVDATWNLFSGGARLAAHREALASQRAAEAALADTRNRVISEVRQAVEALVAAQEQLVTQRRKLRLTREVRDLVRKEYDAGQASLVRLNEAQRDFVIAEAQLAAERVNLRLAWSALRAAVGTGRSAARPGGPGGARRTGGPRAARPAGATSSSTSGAPGRSRPRRDLATLGASR